MLLRTVIKPLTMELSMFPDLTISESQIECLTFNKKNKNLLPEQSIVESGFYTLFSKPQFTLQDKLGAIESFYNNYFQKSILDSDIKPFFANFLEEFLADFRALKDGNVSTNLIFLFKISSYQLDNPTLLFDYTYRIFLDKMNIDSFKSHLEIMRNFVSIVDTLKSNHLNEKFNINKYLMSHHLKDLSKDVNVLMKRVSSKSSPESKFLINFFNIFSSYFRLIHLMMENPNPSINESSLNYELSRLIDTITIGFVILNGKEQLKNFCDEFGYLFSSIHINNYTRLGFHNHFPISQFVRIRRDDEFEGLFEYVHGLILDFREGKISGIVLDEFRNLFESINEKFKARSLITKWTDHIPFWNMIYGVFCGNSADSITDEIATYLLDDEFEIFARLERDLYKAIANTPILYNESD